MKKNSTDQTGGNGMRTIASGYAVKASAGPAHSAVNKVHAVLPLLTTLATVSLALFAMKPIVLNTAKPEKNEVNVSLCPVIEGVG
jgi:hypothetical protein